jgi:hypothetical protein
MGLPQIYFRHSQTPPKPSFEIPVLMRIHLNDEHSNKCL